ncbi:MAG TPA: AAA family ATPase [Polyangiaceae bacterium]|nr:AAA family ATPase [Polyangiaceae bacterium]
MPDERALPQWTEELKRRYLRGEALEFVLHGNVNDLVLAGDKFVRATDLLEALLSPSKDVVVQYNVATGVRFAKKRAEIADLDSLLTLRDPEKILPALEKLLHAVDKVAVIIDYAEMVAPAGDPNFFSSADRQSVVTLHRWSFSPAIERADSVILIVTENLSELSPKLVSNPTTAILKVPMPDEAERRAAIRALAPSLDATWQARLAEITAGLKIVQIKALLSPEATGDGTATDREKTLALIYKRKREIIERECFGLIEFVEPSHDFSVVGGVEEVKKELALVADNIKNGKRNRCPMGILFTGPMGTGKTFVAEAFVKETGFTAIKFKNFRSKWVGATEGNLEKILAVVQALGQVIVIVDEGDRAFGNQGGDGDGDGGTSSRVMARLKEFMSDTQNRGRVLFIIMTNRPDKLDIDIKRAGRLDRKIPFLYPQEPAEVEGVLAAQLRKHRIASTLEFPRDRDALSAKMVGYSNADLEAVVLLANDYSADAAATPAHFAEAMRDYLPSRDSEMLEFMELIAVFEASNRRMLPKKYADLGVEELHQKLALLRARVGNRR